MAGGSHLPDDLFKDGVPWNDGYEMRKIEKSLYHIKYDLVGGDNRDKTGDAIFGYITICLASVLSQRNGFTGWVRGRDQYTDDEVSFYIALTNRYKDIAKHSEYNWPPKRNAMISAYDANTSSDL